MRFLKLFFAGCLSTLLFSAQAQVPGAPELLPDDTIGLITVPSYQKLASAYKQSPLGQFWADPAMKNFRENFLKKFQSEVVEPLEKEIRADLGSYHELLQGQVTIAFTPPKENTASFFGLLLLIDSGDKSDALSSKLAEVKKKWTESGKELRTEQIRGTEFTQISFTQGDLQNLLKSAFPDEDAEEDEAPDPAQEKTVLYVGQSKSLLIAGENPKAIEKLLARQSGGEVPPLSEQTSFQKSKNLLFRESLGYAWVNFEPIYQHILKLSSREQQSPEGMQFDVSKMLPALGLAGMKQLAVSFSSGADGTSMEAFAGIPEAERTGLFKMFAIEDKSAAPPAFVPADVVQFQRVRLDAQKAWAGLESTLNAISPQTSGMLQMMIGMIEQVGQQQDPSFSFKRNFISNLGDDFITYQKLPRSNSPADLQNPPALILIGSQNAVQLAEAIRFVSMLGPVTGDMKEREFLGKKVYSIAMGVPQDPSAGEDEPDPATAPPAQTISFAASGDYVAISADNAILEEYLRSVEAQARPLRELSGLGQAAQKVGGMDKGLFSFENQKESYRALWDMVKKDPQAVQKALPLQFQGAEDGSGMTEWVDFSLLPSWEQISKYFGIAVMSGTQTSDGILIRAYSPTPPEVR